jgi:hypothetical protein
VTVTRPGRLSARVEIAMGFADGSELVETWDGRATFRRFVYERPSPLTRVVVDPAGKLALERRVLDNGVAPARSGPAWRGGARAGFWLQTAAALVGP